MNSGLEGAAQARVDEVLPWQEDALDLLGAPAAVVAHGAQLREARRGGRPAGARNKRLDEVARLVRERFGDVLMRQVAVATMPLADLLAIGLKPAEALAEQRLSAATVLPYIEQRRPLAVDVTGRQVVHLHIELGSAESEADQGVSGGFVVELDGAELDSARNALMPQVIEPARQLIADQAPPPPPAVPPPAAPEPAPPPPGGPVFAPARSLPAPAGVVSRHARVFPQAPHRVPPEPGVGGRAA